MVSMVLCAWVAAVLCGVLFGSAVRWIRVSWGGAFAGLQER